MFRNDYSDPAAKEVLEAVIKLSGEQNPGYGEDRHSANAKELIRSYFGIPDADIHFLAGGTVTNMTVISYFLKPYEAVIACDTAHINVHETGAVEASGHKVITCPNNDGKLIAGDVEKAFLLHSDEHMVKPRMVYISDATETGTVYTKDELCALRDVCDRYGLLLFLDGARLGPALTCGEHAVEPEFIANICDVFYAGGTKNGLLFGEAVIIKDPAISEYFRYHIKNRGAMLAKGFVVGAQFEALFTDRLFEKLAANSVEKAMYIKKSLVGCGAEFEGSSPTNQQFIRLGHEQAKALEENFGCEKWSENETGVLMRIVTSFSTTKEDCDELIEFIKNLL